MREPCWDPQLGVCGGISTVIKDVFKYGLYIRCYYWINGEFLGGDDVILKENVFVLRRYMWEVFWEWSVMMPANVVKCKIHLHSTCFIMPSISKIIGERKLNTAKASLLHFLKSCQSPLKSVSPYKNKTFCYGLNCAPPTPLHNAYIEVLTPGPQNVTVFRDT